MQCVVRLLSSSPISFTPASPTGDPQMQLEKYLTKIVCLSASASSDDAVLTRLRVDSTSSLVCVPLLLKCGNPLLNSTPPATLPGCHTPIP